MRSLNLLPVAAAFAAALPSVEIPNKDIAVLKREPKPVCASLSVGTETGGCYDPSYDPYAYTVYDVVGVKVYELVIEGTSSSYKVTFKVHDPNTNEWTYCDSSVQNSADYQPCERVRTAFIFNIDDNELAKAVTSISLKVLWVYVEGILPRVIEHSRGNWDNEDAYKNLVYHQIGDITLQVNCASVTTDISGSHWWDTEMHTCYQHDESCGQEKPPADTVLSCKYDGEITIEAKVLNRGEPDYTNHQ